MGIPAADDTINWKKLLEAMKEFKIPQKRTGLTRATLKHIKYRFKRRNNLSEPFRTSMGVRQGNASPCILFNMVWHICPRQEP
jgi:hypothetical protein